MLNLESSASEPEVIQELQTQGAGGELSAAQSDTSDAVCTYVHDARPEVAAAAIEALGCMGSVGAKHCSEVSKMLEDPNAKVKLAACQALGKFGPVASSCAPKLIKIIESASKAEDSVKAAAALCLGLVKADNGVDTLSGLLGDSSPDVVSAACVALGSLGAESKAIDIGKKLDSDKTKYGALCALTSLKSCGNFADTIVSKCLGDSDIFTRAQAVMALGTVPGSASTVAKRLKSDDPGVRAAAAYTLGKMEAKSYAKDVAALLSDAAEDTAWMAMSVGGGACARSLAPVRKPICGALLALGMMEAESMASDVAEKTSDTDWEVRACAAEALGYMGEAGKDMSNMLATCLDDDTYVVRAKACLALGACKADDQVDRLAEMLSDKSPEVRSAAAMAMASMGSAGEKYTSDVFALLTATEASKVKCGAMTALSKMGETAYGYTSVIATFLFDEDPTVVCAAIGALSKMGQYGSAFSEEVLSLTDHAYGPVAAAAKTTCQSWGVGVPMLSDAGEGIE
mmetsp:Transcript_14174/g.25001  ORF Transcript_14174/g.25001 Transcript_14174/m.25001 type:complete len:514 (+) Transcript_14174:72-1613(+)